MKCNLCGVSTEETFLGPNDIMLCDKCHTIYKNNKEEVKVGEVMDFKNAIDLEEVVEKSKVDVTDEEVAPVNPVKCEITLGVLKNGSLYFNVAGEGADLLSIDGLLAYGSRVMKKQWEAREVEKE